MVAPSAAGEAMRFQLAPEIVDLTGRPREGVMDAHPMTYRVMADELQREGKLREFGTVEGEKISNPANYLFIAYEAAFRTAGLTAVASLRNGRSYASDLGRLDLAIARDGAVQTTIELPPGTELDDIATIQFHCSAVPPNTREPLPHSGTCTLRWAEAGFKGRRGNKQPEWRWRPNHAIELIAGQGVALRP